MNRRLLRKSFHSNYVAEIVEEVIADDFNITYNITRIEIDVNNNDECLIIASIVGFGYSIISWIIDRDGILILDEEYISEDMSDGFSCALQDNGDFMISHSMGIPNFSDPNYSEAYFMVVSEYNADNSGWLAVNSVLAGEQNKARFDVLPNGEFVVVYDGNGYLGDTQGIYVRAFNSYNFPGVRMVYDEESVTEDGSFIIASISLGTEPIDNVTVDINTDNMLEGTINITQMIFNSSNWNIPQDVIITGVDDLIDDGDIIFNVELSSSASVDEVYSSLDNKLFSFTNLDDDSSINVPESQSSCISNSYNANIIATNVGNPIESITVTSSNQAVVLTNDISVTNTGGSIWEISINENEILSSGTTTLSFVMNDGVFDYLDSFDLTFNGAFINGGADQSICQGSDAVLTANNPDNATISWSGGVSDGQPISLSIGTHVFTVTANLDGCISTDQVTVEVVEAPANNLSAGSDQSVCEGSSLVLQASNPDGYSITWSGGVIDGNSFVPPLGNNTYTVSASLEGCIVTDDVSITVTQQPDILFNAGDDQEVCEGTEITLIADVSTSVETYSWSDNIEDGIGFSQDIGTETYVLTGNFSGCVYSDQITVTVNEQPDTDFSAGDDQTVCSGEEVVLEAENTDGVTFTWEGGIIDGQGFVQDEGEESYTVNAIIEGCQFSDVVLVEVLASIAQPGVTLFGGELITSSGDSYQWYYNGILIPSLITQSIIPIENGLYSVVITIDGCESPVSDDYNYTANSVEEYEREITFYPNPVKNILHVELEEELTIKIYNLLGEIVFKKMVNGDVDLDLSFLTDGFYEIVFLSNLNSGKTYPLVIGK